GSDTGERGRAAEELSRLGPEAQAAAIPLARACGDNAEEVREWAVAALEDLGPPAVADCAGLAELLSDEHADVAYWAATLLGRLQAAAAPALSALTTALAQSPHLAVQQRAVWALGAIGPAAGNARPALEKAAAGQDPRLADLAQAALKQIDRA